jgi:ABC-type bacteriocin/lantibiotic exporter with double-glycine peptidase domain
VALKIQQKCARTVEALARLISLLIVCMLLGFMLFFPWHFFYIDIGNVPVPLKLTTATTAHSLFAGSLARI